MKNTYSALLFSLMVGVIPSVLIGSCRNQAQQEDALVEADLGNEYPFLEGKTIYLGNMGTQKIEDSAVVSKGRFRLRLPAQLLSFPLETALLYRANQPNEQPYRELGFANPFKNGWWESTFYLEKGVTRLEADTAATTRKFIANLARRGKLMTRLRFVPVRPQTAVAFQHVTFRANPNKLPTIAQYNTDLARRYSTSPFVLKELYYKRTVLNDQELNQLMALFDDALHQTVDYKSLTAYLQYTQSPGTDFPKDISLDRPDRSRTSSVLAPNKPNLVVFWASWCGPCRQEIPQLKELYARHKDQLSIISISVDKQEDRWQTALKQEQMPWPQYRADPNTAFWALDRTYQLSSIPVWLLFGPNQKLIKRQVGMSTGANSVEQQVSRLLAQGL